jgi:hypothetical protein
LSCTRKADQGTLMMRGQRRSHSDAV